MVTTQERVGEVRIILAGFGFWVKGCVEGEKWLAVKREDSVGIHESCRF